MITFASTSSRQQQAKRLIDKKINHFNHPPRKIGREKHLIMSIIQSIKSGYQFYFITSIRAYRSEYWWFIGFCFVSMLILESFLTDLAGEHVTDIISLILFSIPVFTATIRRLHDTGRSGWLILCGAIPMVGAFILLYLLTRESDDDNQYGISPY